MGWEQEGVRTHSSGFPLIISIGRFFCTLLRITSFSPVYWLLEEHSDIPHFVHLESLFLVSAYIIGSRGKR